MVDGPQIFNHLNRSNSAANGLISLKFGRRVPHGV